jgi:hypothetical protein
MSNFEFCLPTNGKAVPSAPEWFHEIKYDGLYEASRVKKFFRDQHFFFSCVSRGFASRERSSALMARQALLLGRAERSTPGARRVAPEGARG